MKLKISVIAEPIGLYSSGNIFTKVVNPRFILGLILHNSIFEKWNLRTILLPLATSYVYIVFICLNVKILKIDGPSMFTFQGSIMYLVGFSFPDIFHKGQNN